MSYFNARFFHRSSVSAPARQTISTTYTELTGSKCAVRLRNSSSAVYYKYCCYWSTYVDLNDTSTEEDTLIHFKLQKSNDNFVSNIVDIDGSRHNESCDTIENNDYLFKPKTAFYIVEDFSGYTHIRLVARSYSTSQRGYLHRTFSWDGSNTDEKYFNTSLIVSELEA